MGTLGPGATSVYFAVWCALYRLQSLMEHSNKLLLAAACNDLHSLEGQLCGGGCRGFLLDDGFRWWSSERTATSFVERCSSVRVELG